MSAAVSARPPFDDVIETIAHYVTDYGIESERACEGARLCLLDSLGCAFEALAYPECTRLIGPVAPGTIVPNGARVPGTPHVLDAVSATFSIGALVRWIDYSDAYFGATVMHPSDTLSGILAVADASSRARRSRACEPLLVQDVLRAAIKAYEIVGWLGVANNFTRTGLDNTFLCKIALAAVTAHMMGGDRDVVANAVSNAFIDGHALATFRRAPNTGSRKSWAAADAASRGVWLAMLATKGEMGYPTALTAKTWGFYDVLFGGRRFEFARPLGTFTIENVLYKISYPAALHAQTAVEAAIRLHPRVKHRLAEIERIELWTHETCILMIDKRGPLANFADRDHCVQYMAAIGLIFGDLTARHYEDEIAADPRIDTLRDRMVVIEDESFNRDYADPGKRANANALRIQFSDGTCTERVAVEYPLGHPARRTEALPLLREKLDRGVTRVFAAPRARALLDLCSDRRRLASTPVDEFMDMMVL